MEIAAVDFERLSEDYRRVERAIQFLVDHHRQQPNLKDVAEAVSLSEYHFQRLFTRWVGISPKRFLQFLTKENAKSLLDGSTSLLDVAYESGLSGPSRLHDLFVSCEAVTPGEYKRRGSGLTIQYGFHSTPFGECLLALTERGICNLAFVENGDRQAALATLQSRWMRARLVEDRSSTRPIVWRIFTPIVQTHALPLYLQGTNFQIKVWEALLQIPAGRVVTYQDIAVHIGMPNASRAVGNAVASNPIPVLVPCHRVIRKAGEFGGYRYGTARKIALLGWEMAKERA